MKKADLLRLVATGNFKPCTEFDPKTRKSRKGLIDDSNADFILVLYDNEVQYCSDSGNYRATLN